MRFLFLISLYFFSFLSAEPYLTSENDPLSLVDGIVNVYNGKLIQKNVDVQIGGSKPFEINRYYDSGHHFTGKLGYGIGLSTPLLVTFERKEKKRNLRFEQRSGFEIVCTVKKVSGKKKTAYYKGSVDQDFLDKACSRANSSLLHLEAIYSRRKY